MSSAKEAVSGDMGHHLLNQSTLWPVLEDQFLRTVVRIRIDEKTKNGAATVLSAIGFTMSDAFRLMMVGISAEKRLRFKPLVPNEESIAAMEAARLDGLAPAGVGR